MKHFLLLSVCVIQSISPLTQGFQIELRNTVESGADNDRDDTFIDLPVFDCDEPTQLNYGKLTFLDMEPPCETTNLEGYCGIRRNTNITLISKFQIKQAYEHLRVQVHLVDKNLGFETILWPEFSACHSFFNLTCPEEEGLRHSYVFAELPKSIPPANAIVAVRLLTVNDKKEKNVAICRKIKLHIL